MEERPVQTNPSNSKVTPTRSASNAVAADEQAPKMTTPSCPASSSTSARRDASRRTTVTTSTSRGAYRFSAHEKRRTTADDQLCSSLPPAPDRQGNRASTSPRVSRPESAIASCDSSGSAWSRGTKSSPSTTPATQSRLPVPPGNADGNTTPAGGGMRMRQLASGFTGDTSARSAASSDGHTTATRSPAASPGTSEPTCDATAAPGIACTLAAAAVSATGGGSSSTATTTCATASMVMMWRARLDAAIARASTAVTSTALSRLPAAWRSICADVWARRCSSCSRGLQPARGWRQPSAPLRPGEASRPPNTSG